MNEVSAIELFLQAGIVVKSVMIVLIFASIISWIIIFERYIFFRKANENRFNVLEKVTRAINENKTFDAKNKALKNVEDQFLKGELTQPTSGKGTKNLRSEFVSYQKLAEKDVLNKFGEYTPQHILDSFASNTAFKK